MRSQCGKCGLFSTYALEEAVRGWHLLRLIPVFVVGLMNGQRNIRHV